MLKLLLRPLEKWVRKIVREETGTGAPVTIDGSRIAEALSKAIAENLRL